jgi:phosphonate transport system substrate-binding protein
MYFRASGLKRHGRRLATLFAVLLAVPVLAAEPPPLQMGVFPFLSSERLFQTFLPMKDYLETQLKRRIVLSTAPDFKTFVQRVARGDYDFYYTAPHLALLAETDHGHRRVCRVTRELDAHVVVRHDSPAQRIEDLRGRSVISADALAITSLLGEKLLRDHDLRPGRDYQLARTASHNNALLTVYHREADAAFTGGAVFEQSAPDVRRELRILASAPVIPHTMIMAHPRLPAAEYARLKSAFLAFTRDGPGRQFFEMTNLGDMGPITDADMERLRPFLKDLKERLK